MPTYEYACTGCQHQWEFEQSIRDDAITECPKCHEQTARRQISRGTGFILKGGGWYSDLYASGSNKPAESSSTTKSSESSNGSTSASTAESTESKTESKPSGTTAAA